MDEHVEMVVVPAVIATNMEVLVFKMKKGWGL